MQVTYVLNSKTPVGLFIVNHKELNKNKMFVCSKKKTKSNSMCCWILNNSDWLLGPWIDVYWIFFRMFYISANNCSNNKETTEGYVDLFEMKKVTEQCFLCRIKLSDKSPLKLAHIVADLKLLKMYVCCVCVCVLSMK